MHLQNPVVFAAYFLCLGFCSAQVKSNITSGEPCQSRGICGAFGVCYQKDHPICSCLPGFEPRSEEWYSGNWSGGCARRVGLNCNNRTTTDRFARVQVVLVAGYVESWSGPERECQSRCLTNCSCLAYAFNGAGGCRFWSGSLSDVQKFPSDSVSHVYIRLSNTEFGQNQGSKKMIIVLLLVGFFILSICTYVSWKWILARRGKKKSIELVKQGAYYSVDTSLQDVLVHINLEELALFNLETLAIATDNFCEASKLGKGVFGTVYKGELVDGSEIAVKRVSKTCMQGMKEFMKEVVLISKLQHRNLVRLTGCCIENKEAMLVYEYMPNKSLDFYLFDQSQEALDWRKRWNIIEGICRGLLYLHRDSRLKIIHRDLKPSNILLDDDWTAKISDFGMARIFGTKPDDGNTWTVVGTSGYMAPEYALEGKFSEKSDVFSFGIMMLEIASGRRMKDGSLNLLGHVWNLWHEDNIASLIDRRISSMRYRVQVMRCIQIGLLCVEAIPGDRPSISALLSMLTTQTS